MSYYSAIDRRINADEWFRNLKIEEQWLWFRLLTGPHVTAVAGLWAATEEGLARAFRIPVRKFRRLFRAFSGHAFADWDAGVIYLPNALRIEPNQPRNEATLKGWIKPLELIPECPLRDSALADFIAWIEQNPKRFPNGVPSGFPDPRLKTGMIPGGAPPTVTETVKPTVTETVTGTVKPTVTETVPSRARAHPRTRPNQDQDQETETETETGLSTAAATRGAFRMHPAWRPTEASRQACLVALVPEWALPVFVGEFIGHFAPLDDEQTDAEWNQRWCKWVTRGWNDPDRRPKLPPQQKDRDAEREHQARLAARAEARKAARDAEVLAKYGPKAKTPAKAPERPADAPDPDRVRRLGDGIGRPS